MSKQGGTAMAIPSHMVQAASTGMDLYNPTPGRSGWEGWFGPGAPIPPSAPPEVRGRQWDLPVGINMVQTRKNEGVSHAQLRSFADACDIVRLLIETRKDQLCGRGWSFKVMSGTDKPAPQKKLGEAVAKPDARLAEITKFFKRPDRVHSWSEWLRMVLEDLFVLDAPCLYLQRTMGPLADGTGDLYALRPIDGSTIKKIIDVRGWTPTDKGQPAFQQILHGVVAADFTVDELLYKPRNVRTHRIYGYSHVEQVIITARQWLSRQASNLEYYESGNLPEGFLQGAQEWTPEQIGQFQRDLDTMLSGNFAARRKVRVVPFDAEYQAVKEPALKSDFDEWLARIACFAFGYPPTPFIKQMNRSTSDNDAEAGDEEGEAPIARWVKELVDHVVQCLMGFDDVEFVWEDKEAADPKERAEIDKIYIDAKVLDPDEVREDLGRAPLTPEQREKLNPPPPPMLAGPDGKPVPGKPVATGAKPSARPGAKPPGKLGKAHQGDGVDLDSPAAVKLRKELADELVAALGAAADEAAGEIVKFLLQGERNAAIIAQQLSLAKMYDIEELLSKALTQVAKDAGAEAVGELGIAVDTNLVNDTAVAWAERRAAELIGKAADGGGELLESTRDLIRNTIQDAIEEGWSNKQLQDELVKSYGFSKSRASTIARTETAFASINGNMAAWIASGIVKKKVWLLSNSEGVCTVCGGNVGDPIPLLADFPSGDLTPPAHPNCRCSVAPIVED